MTSTEIRKRYKEFWEQSPRNGREVPNVSLVPNNDPTLLFVNSGMFPLNPYLSGQPHPLGTRLFNFQRCLRTKYDEMLEVGDNRHTLMFEMMGVWSLGDFTKQQQIPWIMEFWVEVCGIDPCRIYVSVFEGNDVVPRDDEAIAVWKETFRKYGIEAEFSPEVTNIPKDLAEGETWKYRIFPYQKKKNWWQRAEDAPGELGGPTSEMFFDMGEIVVEQDQYHINDDSGRFIEIGNNVFMEYRYSDGRQWVPLEKKNIDFGGGFERVAMISQGKQDIFETDIYEPVLTKITELSGKPYKHDDKETEDTKYFRILADHTRAAVFILGDGIRPSNKDQGYVLRRFIRRLVRYGMKLGLEGNFTTELANAVVEQMGEAYPHIQENREMILTEMTAEEVKFRKTLSNGLKEINKLKSKQTVIDGEKAFFIYETYGFPLEMTLDEFGVIDETQISTIEKDFSTKVNAHRSLSKAGAEQKFSGGLADHSTEVTKLHTAHHLLLKALQIVVDPAIRQKGSNITGERLRIDFNYDNKISDEQIAEVERLVNDKITEGLDVHPVVLKKETAEKIGAQMEFGQKYPDLVNVYVIGEGIEALSKVGKSVDEKAAEVSSNDPRQPEVIFKSGSKVLKDDDRMEESENEIVKIIERNSSKIFSMEFCGGPHVKNTALIGDNGQKKFKITKQESSGADIRRLKAQLV